MKKYAFVSVKTSKPDSHQEAIFHYAKKGYRFICAIPKEFRTYGPLKLDLVFEIDEPTEPE